ncbi:uncharacterized protein [Lepeophtheirus salmonis]|uniref:uncharacterized protein isoform X2 n=1 Tax=Lepeophtheirus salmonis TaxID=72036 RepID=UPI001AE40F40|nr:uncharacterized protein LOC121124198 isoform X2 [Lepeophtheirus salmonis]
MECTQVLNYDDEEEEEEMDGIFTQMCFYLEIYMSASGLDVRYVDLSPGFNKVGREKDRVSVHLDHPTVSRVHAQIVLEDNGLVTLEDLGSANKTWKNSSRLQPHIRYTLQGDELLKFGDIRAYIHQGSKPPIITETVKKSPLLIPETPLVVKKRRPIIFDDDKSFIPASQSSPLVLINESCNDTDVSIIMATQKGPTGGSSVLNAETQNLTEFINSTAISEDDTFDESMKGNSKSELKDDTGLFFLPTQKFDDVNTGENDTEDNGSKNEDIIKLKFSKKASDMDDVLNDIFSQDDQSPVKYSNETPIEQVSNLSDSEPLLLSTQELLDGNDCSQISERISPVSDETKDTIDSDVLEKDNNEWEYLDSSSIVESNISQIRKSQTDNFEFSKCKNRTNSDSVNGSKEDLIDSSVEISDEKDAKSNSSEKYKHSLVNGLSILEPYLNESTSFKYFNSFVTHHVHEYKLNECSESRTLDSNSTSYQTKTSLQNMKDIPEIELKLVRSQSPQFSSTINLKEIKQKSDPSKVIKCVLNDSNQKVYDPFPLSQSLMIESAELEEGLVHVNKSSSQDAESHPRESICNEELEHNIHYFLISFLPHMVPQFNKYINECEHSFMDTDSSKNVSLKTDDMNISKRTRSSRKSRKYKFNTSHIKVEIEDNQTALDKPMNSSKNVSKVKTEFMVKDDTSIALGSVGTRRATKKKFSLISDESSSDINNSMPPKKRPNKRKSDTIDEVTVPSRRSSRLKKTDQVPNEVTSNESLKRKTLPVIKDEPKRKSIPVIKDEPKRKSIPVIKDEPKRKSIPVIKDEPKRKSIPVIKDEPKRKSIPVIKDEPKRKSIPVIKDEPIRKRCRGVGSKVNDNKIKVEPHTEKSSTKKRQSTRNDLKNKTLQKEDSTRSGSRHRFKPVLMFTGFDDTKTDTKIAKELGGTVTENINDCNLIVMDKLRRTVKMVSMVGKGVPIVDRNYLLRSKEAMYFLDPWKYLIYDEEFQRQYSFVLSSTLRQAEKKPLLSELEFYVTKSVDPRPAQLKSIIECSGGKFIRDVRKKQVDKIIIISCPKDHILYKKHIQAGFMVVSKEFLLSGLLKYELDFKTFALK